MYNCEIRELTRIKREKILRINPNFQGKFKALRHTIPISFDLRKKMINITEDFGCIHTCYWFKFLIIICSCDRAMNFILIHI